MISRLPPKVLPSARFEPSDMTNTSKTWIGNLVLAKILTLLACGKQMAATGDEVGELEGADKIGAEVIRDELVISS